jgi:hypothetical protein
LREEVQEMSGIGPGEIERILRGDEARRHAEAQRRADERRREEMERTRVGGSDRYDPTHEWKTHEPQI